MTLVGGIENIQASSGGTVTNTGGPLALNAVVLGNGANDEKTTPNFVTNGTNTLTVGVAGSGNGVLALSGNTSGTATITAPAVAGTTTNAIVSSNSVSAPGFQINGGATSGHFLRGNGTNFVDSAIQAGDVPSGTVLWNQIGNPNGNLALSMGTNTTSFNQTNGTMWLWNNTTAATSGVAQSSPIINLQGNYWNGAATATDVWSIQDVITNGTNGESDLVFSHSGSPSSNIIVPSIGILGSASVAGSLFLGGFKTTFNNVGLLTQYNNINTVSNGIPSEYATVDRTGQVAAITATTLYTPVATGMFRVSAYLKITTTGTSPVLGPVTITYTDGTDSVAQSNVMLLATQAGAAATSNAGNTTTSTLNGSMVIFALTGVAIQYAVALTGTVGTAAYEVHLKLEAL